MMERAPMDRLLNVSTMQSGNGCTRLQPLTRCTRNNALKQQTSYLFGKENIHQVMVKNKRSGTNMATLK